MSKSYRISRRTVLRGVGATVALPVLDAMLPVPAFGASTPTVKRPVRMAFLCVPNGVHMPEWTPDKSGDEMELKAIMEPLAKFKNQTTVLTGLTLDGARPHGDGPGDHARSCAAFLTGAHPKKTDGADIRNGISVDQLAAEKLGKKTRLASLELGIDHSAQSGNCDSGYSCAYSSNLAWRTETSPVGHEVNPAAVFDRLFGGGEPREQTANREQRRQQKKSLLDFVLEDANDLRRKLGSGDQRKLDEYLHAVRDVERRIVGGPKLSREELDALDLDRPEGMPREYAEHVRLMLDLMAVAFQTDTTRVTSLMFANEGSNRSYKEIEVPEGHHDLSHHGKDKAKQEKITRINRFHISLVAHFLERLSKIPEDNGSLLDNCMIVYGSGIGDGDRHNHDDLPIALFGRGGGAVKPGRHLVYPKNTPLTNLYVSMLDIFGVKVDKFSDSQGRADEIRG